MEEQIIDLNEEKEELKNKETPKKDKKAYQIYLRKKKKMLQQNIFLMTYQIIFQLRIQY